MPISEGESESAQALLQPYLSALVRLSTVPDQESAQSTQPAFTVFYTEGTSDAVYPIAPTAHQSSDVDQAAATVLISPPVSSLVSEVSDSAAEAGEALFWACISSLRARGIKPGMKPEGEAPTGETDVWPTSMWPALDTQDDEDM